MHFAFVFGRGDGGHCLPEAEQGGGALVFAGVGGDAREHQRGFDPQAVDPFSSQDVRLTKTINLTGNVNLRLIGEVFNIFNTSNLTNFNYNLANPAVFGQANQRVGQTFGSGGPRAFQFAGRLSF